MATAAVANGLVSTLAYFLPVFRLQWVRILFFAVMFGGLVFTNVRRHWKGDFSCKIQYGCEADSVAADFDFRMVFY